MIGPEPAQPQRSTDAPRRPFVWHIITCEYPPAPGGVSDYAFLLAHGLASFQDIVHIWGPASPKPAPEIAGVTVHPSMGRFSPADLLQTGRELNAYPGPRQLLVQYVPHGFGYKSLNVFFCLWLWSRSVGRGDEIGAMVHEPFLEFNRSKIAQSLAAFVHRVMMLILLGTSRYVWVSTPAWEGRIRPFDLRRHKIGWLPLPSNVPVLPGAAEPAAIHNRYAPGDLLIGHFSTFNPLVVPLLHGIIPPLLTEIPQASLILIGPGGEAFRAAVLEQHADLANRIHAIGPINARDPKLSFHLSACDLLIQPYPDGVTSRRTTVMAALAHGRPTVTTIGTLTEPFWASSGAVASAPAYDNTGFVKRAVALLKDPQARAVLGASGQQFYRQKFDIQYVVETLRSAVIRI